MRMTNKTCGECKHCTDKKIIATCKHIGITAGDVPGSNCRWFESQIPTNDDMLRQMSNAKLAEFLRDAADDICNNNRSVEDILAWLNAPAESEGKDE